MNEFDSLYSQYSSEIHAVQRRCWEILQSKHEDEFTDEEMKNASNYLYDEGMKSILPPLD